MGFCTTVIIRNDGLGEIERNPEEFGRNLAQAILQHAGTNEPVEIRCGSHTNVAQVVAQYHDSSTHAILVGGGTATDLGPVGGWQHGDLEEQKKMLKRAKENIKMKEDAKHQQFRDALAKEAREEEKEKFGTLE